MTTDDAYETARKFFEATETAIELIEFADMIWASGETERYAEAEDAYRQGVAIRDQYFP
jgi:hypothetical protein